MSPSSGGGYGGRRELDQTVRDGRDQQFTFTPNLESGEDLEVLREQGHKHILGR